jgi:subtilisin family serine protease
MKKKVYFLLPSLIGMIGIVFALNYHFKPEIIKGATVNEKSIIVIHFDKTVISGSSLITKLDNIHSASIRDHLKQYGICEVQAVFRNRYNVLGILKPLKYKSDLNLFLEGWQELPELEKSKAEKLVNLLKTELGVLDVSIEEPLPIIPCATPHDTYYQFQWHLKSNLHPAADIDAEQAWDINKGRNDVIIAVCDGGVDYTHPDLDPGNRSHVITGYDSGDDDNNPMDDLPGNDPQSFSGHGTKVAGVIGAITDNYNGVSGIMWNCKIMPVKMVGGGSIKFPFVGTVIDFSATARPTDVADAIDYAVNNGAHVINLSYGFKSLGYFLDGIILRVPLLYSTLVNAYNNNRVVVASMGNEYQNGNPIDYPAAFREVIAVGAIDEALNRASFSNTGSHISIVAPGVGIYTTEKGGGITGLFNGTSASAPLVSGVAGLVISQGLERSFNLTNDDIKHIMEQTADDIVSYGVGFDVQTGYGKVNAKNALTLLKLPNVLYHQESYGGTSTKISDIGIWTYVGSKWGLTAGNYIHVEQYEITKHINFSIPFCAVPKVWLRERECISMNYGSPNDGYPYGKISNITKTGFDVKYALYFVPYDVLGRTINKWVPSVPNSTKIAYTAVAEPNPAGAANPISGQTIVCSSGSPYSISNLQQGCTISWNCGSNITRVSAQGSNPCTFKATGNGATWIEATIYDNSSCGSFVLPRYSLFAGSPTPSISVHQISGEGEPLTVLFTASPFITGAANTYKWYVNNVLSESNLAFNEFDRYIPCNQTINVKCSISNSCGTSTFSSNAVVSNDCSGGKNIVISPNPAAENIQVNIILPNESDTTNNTLLLNSIETSRSKVNSYLINITDAMGAIVHSSKQSINSFIIPIANLKNGNYILSVIDGTSIYQKQLIIKH